MLMIYKITDYIVSEILWSEVLVRKQYFMLENKKYFCIGIYGC